MGKRAKRTTKREVRSASTQRTLQLAEFVRRNLFEFVVQEGMKALQLVLEQDREALCGPAHGKGGATDALRWGHTEGRLAMGGQRVVVRKPRVRQAGKEVALPSWEQFADTDPLDARTVEQLVVGVSTRGYRRSVDELPGELAPHGTSKSAASRRFVDSTKRRLADWASRDLSDERIVVVMLDGIAVGEHMVIVALGIDDLGQKRPLGLWIGATENGTVCGAQLDDLIERGLDPHRPYLFVIDGSKALRSAIRDRFGRHALVQRCQVHKRRNVLRHLPKRLHPSVSKTLRDAYQSTSKAMAKRRLLQLASRLASDHPDAAKSLKEGLDETLTLKGLKLPTALERTLSTTNAIENLNSTIRRITHRVKRWRDGEMVKRWVTTGVEEAERGFRRLRGHAGMPILIAALEGTAERIVSIDEDKQAA